MTPELDSNLGLGARNALGTRRGLAVDPAVSDCTMGRSLLRRGQRGEDFPSNGVASS